MTDNTPDPQTLLDAAWRELELDALASDGPIRDRDVIDAIKRQRPHIERATLDATRPSGDEALRAALSLIAELASAYHQTGSLRDHADPNIRTGWVVGPIATCEDPLCVESLALATSSSAPDAGEPSGSEERT